MPERSNHELTNGPGQGTEAYFDLVDLVSKKFKPWHGVVGASVIALTAYAVTQSDPVRRQLLRAAGNLHPAIYDAVLKDTLSQKIIRIGETRDMEQAHEIEEVLAQPGSQRREHDFSAFQEHLRERQVIRGTRRPSNLGGMSITTTFEITGIRNPGHRGVFSVRLVGNELLRIPRELPLK